MVNLTERQKFILERIIADYIAQARPIASEFFVHRHRLNIQPATVRREFQHLTDAGFLYQPHTSAGRVPTDKGYRFYVDQLLDTGVKHCDKLFVEVEKFLARPIDFMGQAVKILAENSSVLGFSSLPEQSLTFTEGWARVFKEPEFQNPPLARKFSFVAEKITANINEIIAHLVKGRGNGVKIMIGKECHLPKSSEFSIMIAQGILPNRERSAFGLLGPKRMNYSYNITLLETLRQLLT